MAQQTERISFKSPDLDKMLGGGLLKGTSALVSGAPGIGKTTLGLQFLVAGIELGQPGLIISFEEFPASLVRDAAQVGWDLKALEEKDKLGVIFTSPAVLLESLKAHQGPIADIIDRIQPERVVLDSVAHFRRLTRDPLELRMMYNVLINALKRQDITSILLDEAANILQSGRDNTASLPFLVDTVIILRYVELNSAMQRAIAVMKMRGSSHQKEIRRFEIQKGGLKIGDPFANKAGILSGIPHHTA